MEVNWKCQFMVVHFISLFTMMNGRQLEVFNLLEDELVLSIMDYFNSGCLFLFYTPTQGTLLQAATINLEKRLFYRGIPSATLSTSTQVFPKCRRNRPLYVFHDITSTQLHKVHKISIMSDSIWLLLLRNISVEDIFSDVNIPFDCEFLVAQWSSAENVVLTEVYRVAEGLPLQSYCFGTWNPKYGLTAPKNSFYNRRFDLQGYNIRGGIVNYPPLLIARTSGHTTEIDGFDAAIHKILEQRMNFSTTMVPARGGKMSELVAMVVRGETKITILSMAMLPYRQSVIDFVMPSLTSNYEIFIRPPGNMDTTWDLYLRPFSPLMWLIFGVFTLLLAAIFRLLTSSIERRSYIHVLLDIFGALFSGQDQTLLPASNGQTFVTVIYFTGIILVAAYLGALTSFLAVNTYNLPFTSLQGIRDDGTFQFGALRDTNQHYAFMNTTDALHRELYIHQMARDQENFPKDFTSGLRRLCSTKYAFLALHMSFIANLKKNQKYLCEVVSLPDAYDKISIAMGVQKGSPYKGLINHNLHKMRDTGILNLLKKQHLSDQTESLDDTEFSSISLRHVVPLLALLCAAAILATLLVTLEVSCKHFQSSRSKSRHQNSPLRRTMPH